jgi:hypothetical protein
MHVAPNSFPFHIGSELIISTHDILFSPTKNWLVNKAKTHTEARQTTPPRACAGPVWDFDRRRKGPLTSSLSNSGMGEPDSHLDYHGNPLAPLAGPTFYG